MTEGKKPPTLSVLLLNPLGENKSVEEVISTLKRCSKRGVSIELKPDYISILDKFNFSGTDIKRLKDSMKNGIEVCERKERPEDSADVYRRLFKYFDGRIPERYNPRNP